MIFFNPRTTKSIARFILSFMAVIIMTGILVVTTHAANDVILPASLISGGGEDPCANWLDPATGTTRALSDEECYQFLEPLPIGENADGQAVEVTAVKIDAQKTIGESFNNVYMITIGIASVIAVVMITIYGFRYMTNDKNVATHEQLKQKITNVVLGMILLLSIYVILNTINPQLLDVQPDIDAVYAKALDSVYKDYVKSTGENVTFKDFTKYIKTEYIPARDRALPGLAKGPKILITAQAQLEGFYPGSKSYRTKNPGNIANTDNGSTHTYPSFEEGIKAQYTYIQRVATGQHSAYQVGRYNSGAGLTYTGALDQYLKIYATGARTSDSYVNFIIAAFKKEGVTITKNTTMAEIYNMQ